MCECGNVERDCIEEYIPFMAYCIDCGPHLYRGIELFYEDDSFEFYLRGDLVLFRRPLSRIMFCINDEYVEIYDFGLIFQTNEYRTLITIYNKRWKQYKVNTGFDEIHDIYVDKNKLHIKLTSGSVVKYNLNKIRFNV